MSNPTTYHFAVRLMERYGIEYNKSVRDSILSQIQTGKAKFLYRVSRAKTVWNVTINHQPVILIYNSKSKSFVTALPRDYLETNKLVSDTLRFWANQEND